MFWHVSFFRFGRYGLIRLNQFLRLLWRLLYQVQFGDTRCNINGVAVATNESRLGLCSVFGPFQVTQVECHTSNGSRLSNPVWVQSCSGGCSGSGKRASRETLGSGSLKTSPFVGTKLVFQSCNGLEMSVGSRPEIDRDWPVPFAIHTIF